MCNQPNIFKFATSELSQDAFICWLVSYVKYLEDTNLNKCAKDFVALLYNIRHQDTPITGDDVKEIKDLGIDYFIHTGSPHHIRFVTDIDAYPVYEEGKKIRFSDIYQPDGTNVNFVELLADNSIYVRTYERGVENETLSCGTGVTAAALAASLKGYIAPVRVKTKGGELEISFKSDQPNLFHDIFLSGPAKMVFEGRLEL